MCKPEKEHCSRKKSGPRAGLGCLRGSKESSMTGVEGVKIKKRLDPGKT